MNFLYRLGDDYLLTPWCRVPLEKLTGLQLVKKFPAFHGTPRLITALTSVRHLSLSWASSIQSLYPHPTSWRPVLILSTHLRLGLTSKRKHIKFRRRGITLRKEYNPEDLFLIPLLSDVTLCDWITPSMRRF